MKLNVGNVFEPSPETFMWTRYNGRDLLNEMIRAASSYAGDEKAGLHALIKNANSQIAVIDVEAAFINKSSSSTEASEQEDAEDRGIFVDGDEDEDVTVQSAKRDSEIKQDRFDVVTLEKREGLYG